MRERTAIEVGSFDPYPEVPETVREQTSGDVSAL